MAFPAERYLTGNSGCGVALAIGFTTIGLIFGGVSLFTETHVSLEEEGSVLLFLVLLVAAPFGALATARESSLAAWLTAFMLTAMFWGLFVADASLSDEGANIGFGFVLLVSPLIITGAAFAAGSVARRRRS